MNYQKTIVMLVFALFVFFSCGKEHHSDGHQTIQAKLNAISSDSIVYDVSAEEFLAEIQKVLAEVPDSTLHFYVPERKSMITSYPCSSCHSKSLQELQKMEKEEAKKAHWNIKMEHASSETMSCTTCHDVNNMNELQSLTGASISINHSYQSCAQCHSTQFNEWLGGGHGKRLGGWAPPRVINSCVNCHNPHSPGFSSKWPARLNTVKLKEQSSE